MPSYFYRARDTFGRAHEGVEVAASEDEVLRALSQMQLTPVLIEARAMNGAAALALGLPGDTSGAGARAPRLRHLLRAHWHPRAALRFPGPGPDPRLPPAPMRLRFA